MGFPGGSVVKNLPADARDLGLIPGLTWRINGNPLQYSCLGNSMDIGAWQSTALGVAKTKVTEQACKHEGIRGVDTGEKE